MSEDRTKEVVSRRDVLKVGAIGVAGLATAASSALGFRAGAQDSINVRPAHDHGGSGMHTSHQMTVGDIRPGGFDPTAYLTHFDYGTASRLPNGQTLREYTLVAMDREIEVAPGVFFPAWTYNGQVPGPTLRCTEGDRLRITFANAGTHPHTIHFHGIHPGRMDGAFEPVAPGKTFVYEFDAEPFAMQLYHCHTVPLKRHLHKGLYGAFIIDPPGGRPPAKELVMTMNAFDTNFDGENEIYSVNTVAFHYQRHPIQLQVGEQVRIYLTNLTEFDLINSFHLHGNFFRFYRTGSDLERYEFTDNVMLCQGERGILEFSFKYPGMYMFHAHQSEFAELGWMGVFDVREVPHA